MIGETLGNYRIVSQLGSGAMGTVFLGEHERIARRAAIKVLTPEMADNADILRRFFDEARATSLIHHPAIVEVLDCGVHADSRRPYIVMEHLRGETLAEHLRRRNDIPWPEACAIARQISAALAAAHRHGIVHRDVKPANVMLVEPAGRATASIAGPIVKLLDFGVAKLQLDTQSTSQTSPGRLLGTPDYMAPEQCGGEGTVDARTDVYALGCVLFEMITGHPPFRAATVGELILAHQWREAPPVSADVDVPPALARLIARMLSKQPSNRPANMDEVNEALGGQLEQALAPRSATTLRDFARTLPAHWPLVAAGAALAIVTVEAGAYLVHHGRTPDRVAESPPPPSPAVAAPTPVAAIPSTPLAVSADAAPQPAALAAPPDSSPASAGAPPAQRREQGPRRRRPPRPETDTDGIVDL
jgi:eukaryotic-like serine/threonine-protein kinase